MPATDEGTWDPRAEFPWSVRWKPCDPPLNVPGLTIEWTRNRRLKMYAAHVTLTDPDTGIEFQPTLYYPLWLLRQENAPSRIHQDVELLRKTLRGEVADGF